MSKAKQKPLFLSKVDDKVHKKLDAIAKATTLSKSRVVELLLGNSLGVTIDKSVDLTKWIK